MSQNRQTTKGFTLYLLIAVAAFGLAAVSAPLARTTSQDYQRVAKLYSGATTVVGENVSYPVKGAPKISSVIVTMLPGEKTGWHTHGVPLFAYMLEGELQVDYGEKGVRTYRKGDAFLEAMAVPHNGVNKGPAPVRVLAVFMGAEGLKNVLHATPENPPG